MKAALVIWIWFCTYLNCAGWFLSAIHQLNAAGYSIALAFWFAALIVWKKKNPHSFSLRGVCLRKFSKRFRKPFPLAFLILAAMAFLGGAIYAPNNYDALAYRIPRILHWLAADQWHWIHTDFPRVNARACGIEWVSAPLIALTKTDRLLFLINTVSLLFLPGLIFSVFTRLGVRRRVAWHWMWIAPTGYCFLLQAGSVSNDLFGAPFALAAIDFALRAKISRSPCDFFASILAAALMTGAKTSNLPLLLPWAIAILPSFKLIFRLPLRTAAIGLIVLFASVLPILVFNAHYYHGDWAGLSAEGDSKKGSPVLRATANTGLITVENLTPPVFPFANAWNRHVRQAMPAGLSARLHEIVAEPEAAEFHAEEMQTEEAAGLGFGVTLLFLVSIAGAAAKRGGAFLNLRFNSAGAIWKTGIRLTPWISLLALLSQSEVYPVGRILAPYYALLLPLFLTNPAHGQLVKKCWWRAAAFTVFAIAAGLLIVSPARPLFPAQTILAKMKNVPERVREVYSVYAARNDAFTPAKEILPPDLKILGLVTYDDPETSLWRPFGSRRIEHICPQDTAADLKARGIGYILVKMDGFEQRFGISSGDWIKKMDAQIIQKVSLNLRASTGPTDWYLVKLN